MLVLFVCADFLFVFSLFLFFFLFLYVGGEGASEGLEVEKIQAVLIKTVASWDKCEEI